MKPETESPKAAEPAIAERCPACASLETDSHTLDGTELICRECGEIWRTKC